MPRTPKPTALDLFDALNAALDGALVPATPDRAALEVPSAPIEWMVRDFGKLMSQFELPRRVQILHPLLVQMVQRRYPRKTLASVLEASGVSPEEMQAHRLDLRTHRATGSASGPRL